MYAIKDDTHLVLNQLFFSNRSMCCDMHDTQDKGLLCQANCTIYKSRTISMSKGKFHPVELDDGSLSKSRSDASTCHTATRVPADCRSLWKEQRQQQDKIHYSQSGPPNIDTIIQPSSVQLMAIILNTFMAAWPCRALHLLVLLINYTATRKAKIDVKMAQVRGRLMWMCIACTGTSDMNERFQRDTFLFI